MHFEPFTLIREKLHLLACKSLGFTACRGEVGA
jgi:hypothetical protein